MCKTGAVLNEETQNPTNEQTGEQTESAEEITLNSDETLPDRTDAPTPDPPDDSNQTAEDDPNRVLRLPITQEHFRGPLELLVHLISRKEMDVLHVSISAITSEYINIVKNWQEEDLELAGEYLVLAATLYRYKVRALLPKEEQVMEEDDELRDDMLDQRQREYERFRQLAEELRWREQQSSFRFPRLGPSPEEPKEVIEYTEVSVYDLYRTFQRIIEEIGSAPTHILEGENYSIDEKMLEIEALLTHNEHLVLTDYLRTLHSKLEIIVVFMALLELIRLHEIKANQDQAHGEIVLLRGEKFKRSGEDEGGMESSFEDE